METKIPKTGSDIRGDGNYAGGGGDDSSPEALQRQFDAPSVLGRDGARRMEEGLGGAADRRDLKEQEETASSGASGVIDSKEKALAGDDFYKPEGPSRASKIKARLTRFSRKQVATVAITGIIGGGGIFGFSIIQGPLQFMHLSQVLQKPMAQEGKDSESRLKGLLRFARSGDFGETRVGYFGSRSAAKTENKLAKMGVEFTDKNSGGFPREIRIDVRMYEQQTGKKFNAEKYAIDNKLPADQVRVDPKGREVIVRDPKGTLKADVFRAAAKPLVSEAVEKDRLGGKTAAIKNRHTMNKMGAYSKLHPWKRLEAASMKKAIEADEKRRAKKKERGQKAQARFENLKSKISPKAAATGAGVATLQLGVCAVKDVAHEVPLLNYENVNIPARNDAIEAIAMGEQIRANDDFSIRNPAASSRSLKDKEGRTVWQGMALNALANNGSGGGQDLDQDTKKNFSHNSPEADVEKALNDSGAGIVCSPAGQIAGGALGIISIALAAPTGGASLVTYTAFQVGSAAATLYALSVVTQQAVNALKDEPLPERFTDASFQGNIMAFGAEDLAGDFYRKSAGVAQPGSATTIPSRAEVEEQEEFRSRSFFARMFDVKDYRSVTSQAVDRINPSPTDNLKSIASLATKPWSVFSSTLRPLDKKVSAAEGSYDFGFPRYGFQDSEINGSELEDPYDNAKKAAAILNGNPDYIEKAKKCFGVELTNGNRGWQVDIVDNPDGDPEKDVVPSSAEYKGANCNDSSNNWLRVRMFIFDSRTMEAYSCYDGDEEACAAIGLDTPAGSEASEGSFDSAGGLVSGDVKELAKQILDSGKISVSSKYVSQIQDIASGKTSCNVNPTILQLLATIAEKHTVTVSSLNRFCTNTLTASGSASYHYRDGGGHAVDISSVDGQVSTGGTENDIGLLKEILPLLPSGSGIGQVECRDASLNLPEGVSEFSDTCNHIHIQVPVKKAF